MRLEKVFLALCLSGVGLSLSAQRLETVPFGDFERWTVRHIKESGLLGGQVKTLYIPGPAETLEGKRPYDYSRTVWASSNAYAKVSGIVKASLSLQPDAPVTHAILQVSTGCGENFTGEPGNTLWVDNIRLEYAQ